MNKNTFSKNDMINYLKKWTSDNHPHTYELLNNLKRKADLERFYETEIYPLFLNRLKESVIFMAFWDIIRASSGNSKMGAFILCSCYIDYLAFYYSNKSDPNKRYKEFVDIFLPKYDKEKLYKDLRCKLVHNYSEGGSYSFIYNNPSYHLLLNNKNGKTFINLENFIQELYVVSEKLFDMITKEEARLINAVRRHKEAPLLRIFNY